ncbi:hypothetical protein L195_g001363 [Trifolium pratense]|uniref:Uncharacterized protein n=1 Tax=Trifolium pratense TaxID=57577 RepID=A0A2K3NPG2_TRIPR|nr:hypothetical protein L195_g001363 [Trifolium pratense]
MNNTINVGDKQVQYIRWKAPSEDWIRINTYGAARGGMVSERGGILRGAHAWRMALWIFQVFGSL